jgi:hypothetical protein
MRVEIPPEATSAGSLALSRQLTKPDRFGSRMDWTALSRDEIARVVLDAAAPHLFAAWSERLMDEGRFAAAGRARALQRGRATPVDAVTLGDELVRAALSSVSGKDGGDAAG